MLLIAAVAPLMAGTRGRTDRVVCLANLGHIGRAFQQWAAEHGNQNPVLTPVGEGGLLGHPLAINAWVHFAWVSNELATARVLACPSDVATRVASDFSNRPDGGFLYGTYRANALSYFLGVHSFFNQPQAIVAGDRNLRPASFGACAYIPLSGVATIPCRVPPLNSGWANALHFPDGNLLFNDGHAQTVSSHELREGLIVQSYEGANSFHYLLPR